MPDFLLHPENRAYVAGRRARPWLRLPWLSLVLALIGVLAGGALLAAVLQVGDQRGLLGAAWVLFIFAGLVLRYTLDIRRELLLAAQGTVLEGTVVATAVERQSRRLYPLRLRPVYVLTVRYRFVSPVSGVAITGEDQASAPQPPQIMPPQSASVRVLYRDDRQHRLL